MRMILPVLLLNNVIHVDIALRSEGENVSGSSVIFWLVSECRLTLILTEENMSVKNLLNMVTALPSVDFVLGNSETSSAFVRAIPSCVTLRRARSRSVKNRLPSSGGCSPKATTADCASSVAGFTISWAITAAGKKPLQLKHSVSFLEGVTERDGRLQIPTCSLCSPMRKALPILLAFAAILSVHAAEDQITITLNPEAGPQEGSQFVAPVTLINPPLQTFIRRVPITNHRDIVAFYPFRAADGSLGPISSWITTAGPRSSSTPSRRWTRWRVFMVNGRPACAVKISKKIIDGIITMPGGMTPKEVVLLETKYPTIGQEKLFKEQKKNAQALIAQQAKIDKEADKASKTKSAPTPKPSKPPKKKKENEVSRSRRTPGPPRGTHGVRCPARLSHRKPRSPRGSPGGVLYVCES